MILKPQLTEKITEQSGDTLRSYVFLDDSLFNEAGFKVLRNNTNRGFVAANRSAFNGKIKLVYEISGLNALNRIAPILDSAKFTLIFSSILSVCQHLRENGFLQCENIGTEIKDIFVDTGCCKAYLIYLPIVLKERVSSAGSRFEKELKSNLYELIEQHKNISSPAIIASMDSWYDGCDIQMVQNTLHQPQTEQSKNDEIVGVSIMPHSTGQPTTSHPPIAETTNPVTKKEKSGFWPFGKKKIETPPSPSSFPVQVEELETQLLFTPVLEPLNPKGNSKIQIAKTPLKIGKSHSQADVVIQGSTAVSRLHCEIIEKGGTYFVIDQNSLNGTFLNNQKLAAEKQYPFKQGDKLRFANIEFIVR